jgi:hypothetical protein
MSSYLLLKAYSRTIWHCNNIWFRSKCVPFVHHLNNWKVDRKHSSKSGRRNYNKNLDISEKKVNQIFYFIFFKREFYPVYSACEDTSTLSLWILTFDHDLLFRAKIWEWMSLIFNTYLISWKVWLRLSRTCL